MASAIAPAAAAAASCFSRISLPLLLSPPTFNRFLASSCTTTSLYRSHIQNPIFGSRKRIVRSMSAQVNPDFSKSLRSVPVPVAYELLQTGHRYLDVRTPEEFSAGHPVGAVNIPYMFKAGLGMSKNPNFVGEFSSKFGKDEEIVIGCQSGKRSLMAATDLLSAGFTGIIDIAGGYSAWMQNGLPTE